MYMKLPNITSLIFIFFSFACTEDIESGSQNADDDTASEESSSDNDASTRDEIPVSDAEQDICDDNAGNAAAGQSCCRALGVDACQINTFCGVEGDRTIPSCLPEGMREAGESCLEDRECGSESCHPEVGVCLSDEENSICDPDIGCADNLYCEPFSEKWIDEEMPQAFTCVKPGTLTSYKFCFNDDACASEECTESKRCRPNFRGAICDVETQCTDDLICTNDFEGADIYGNVNDEFVGLREYKIYDRLECISPNSLEALEPCLHDEDCQSNLCTEEGRCLSRSGEICRNDIGCADSEDGEKYVCIKNYQEERYEGYGECVAAGQEVYTDYGEVYTCATDSDCAVICSWDSSCEERCDTVNNFCETNIFAQPMFCTDNCRGSFGTANNGICEDGGPNSTEDNCVLGNDCSDCGPR